jgi:hypothetical protein
MLSNHLASPTIIFADDSQLYYSAVLAEVPHLAANVNVAVASVYTWMAENKLKMNEDKTGVIRIGTRNQLSKVGCADSLTVMDCQIPFVGKVNNLGVFLDSTLSFDVHIRCTHKSHL